MSSIDFYYNGRHSSEMGVCMVNLNSGLTKSNYLSNKKIISERIAGNPIPYVYGSEYESLEYTLTLACIEGERWTDEKRREIARWLDTNNFEEFYTDDEPDRYYYLQYQGLVELSHNDAMDGYIEVSMLNDSPFIYSPIQEKRYELTAITSPTVIEFNNIGDDIIHPEMWIYHMNDGDFQIKNLSNGGKDFKFTNLANSETIYIDNKHHDIESDITLTYRYDNFNNNYLELVRGINRLEVTGACSLLFRYQVQLKG
ncbi:phage tail domain-containing protein [Lysinibacillus fusiformis]|uniref:phage tail domain-containing protein n=1 Tax=Lysinibacillus fusiformis TaxID=28031 RepID=UPI00263B4E97|nr:phage tail domain-containing protein [Lysinibacillus fusiformis]MDC6267369.1 phage tail family protein [Lysinibacillus sphaericus]MDN4968197.1 phage tail family protein [Lysinibacillus fusiformis]MDN4968371.1 phage tail family protein [Lysinibacillus fusiformis]